MTINDVITKVNKLKDHSMDEAILRECVEDCDKQIYKEVIMTHDDPVTTETFDERYPLSNDKALLAPDEYAQFYIYYAICQIDFHNAEYDRYTNNMFRYNSALSDYRAYYNRTHRPKGVKYLTTD